MYSTTRHRRWACIPAEENQDGATTRSGGIDQHWRSERTLHARVVEQVNAEQGVRYELWSYGLVVVADDHQQSRSGDIVVKN